ncbi:glycosyltransferase [Sphingobacterium athyrii]|uniref:Glycosyltransferase n=1 Tax=Sphingobacterium athyrii TaxID=2152717 RepID=A0A363NQM2_9SPHI|nr:glycosyltransferase [Sphingobacterium athyrii]PUV22961.1 glycosyltransferase [Sphingobacterium athyrii]
MMKVLHVINNLGVGGAESLLVSMIPLLRENLQIDIVLLDGQDTPFLQDLKKSKHLNIISLSKGSIYNPIHIFRLILIIRKYELVHVHLFPAMYFAAVAKFLSFSNVKLVFTEHSTGNRRLKSSLFRIIDRIIYLHYSKIICITPEVKDILISLGVNKSKLCVIYNGIEIVKFARARGYDRATFGYLPSDIILIMVAGFRREKDHSSVVKALSRLDHRYKLLLVGEGYQKNQVLEEVLNLGLENRVQFIGVRNDIDRLLKTCDIGILSSHWEGFGIAAVEAMAAGLPIVASNVSGLSEVVDGGGLLFKKGNITDLVSKIVSLEEKDYYSNIQRKCLDKAKQYDLKTTVNQLLMLYKTLGQNHNK